MNVLELGNPHVTSAAISAIEDLTDDAIRTVMEEVYRRHTRVLAVRGATGRLHTAQDLKFHIDFLCGALAAGEPGLFADYVRWVAAVLESRGMPVQMLDESLKLLEGFFAGALDPAVGPGVATLFEHGRTALADRRPGDNGYERCDGPPTLPEVQALTHALIRGNVRTARSLAQKAWDRNGNYVEVAIRLFQPALYEVGLLWERNQITVAQEHLATAVCQTLLTRFYLEAAQSAKPTGRKALFAAVGESEHALGLRIVADAFELAGWQVQFLGANTPVDGLIAQIESFRPEIVGLSVSLVQQLPGLQRAIQAIRAELRSTCPTILVGGLPTNQCPHVWRRIGADAWSPDARAAVEEMT